MIRQRLKQVIDACFEQGVSTGKWPADLAGKYTVEVPKREGQGDFSTNMALILAGKQKSNPRQIAAQLVTLLEKETELIDHLEIAGPGFVNIFLKTGVWQQALFPVLEQRERVWSFHYRQWQKGNGGVRQCQSHRPSQCRSWPPGHPW